MPPSQGSLLWPPRREPGKDWLVECMNCGACRTMSAAQAARATCNRCCDTLVVDRYCGRLLACRVYYVRVRPLAGLHSVNRSDSVDGTALRRS